MSNKYKILIIEDEANIRNFVKTLLLTNQYQVFTAENGEEGLFELRVHCPDLILLDLGLPDQDGLDLLVEIRKESMIPVIVLSARYDEYDKVRALDLGANDYVTKPFGTAELQARIRSALRNSNPFAGSTLQGKMVSGDLMIDYDERKVFIASEEIHLTQTEYNIVALLAKRAGRVLTYAEIIQAVWGSDDIGSVKKLQVNMANIRKKMGVKPGVNKYIQNELSIGYRMLLD
jgi:two-component system KDP operon response regulator KdpE